MRTRTAIKWTSVAVLSTLALWRVSREWPGAVLWAQIYPLSGVGFDRESAESSGANRVRVIVTDRGALGYGDINVYRYSPLTGYARAWSAPKVAATPNPLVFWRDARTAEIWYESTVGASGIKVLTLD